MSSVSDSAFTSYEPTVAPVAATHIGSPRRFFIETYGCQMNFNDSEIIASVLSAEGFQLTTDCQQADVVLLNTCSIRENAEQRVRARLSEFQSLKRHNPGVLVGILGCMAERLKAKLLEEEHIVDLVVGPDAYRSLPQLIARAESGQKAVNVLLSREETYADISPVRLASNGVTAFISIMRGCNNMCSFCVVPFTRGRERSRPPASILSEARQLFDSGYREVTLLGQNVDSYRWEDPATHAVVTFAQLLDQVASVHSELRIRFSTSHPKDITDDVLSVMADHPNICRNIHLPVQSGSSAVLQRMFRTYDADWYRRKVDRIREYLPDCAISTDIIVGFCGETEDDHRQTLEMMDYVRYHQAFMFRYSERPGTYAARHFPDDVPDAVKSRRLQEVIQLQNAHQLQRNREQIGKIHHVLVEGPSRRSPQQLAGRNSQNQMIVFDARQALKGRYVQVKAVSCTSATLIGTLCPEPTKHLND
ncbi:MAG: tRNA (N6-isopentenyl adenosine(37)-C2)-methylthiotransferase MiaB [Chitinophagales bacterium]|nr:tRNA (N6-isopentenyl adenosine(37)-C2)-methylthiotransferase MiaB [Chitinophagales bacterium]MDW8393423.1 tRNA (N6-isopentenyl adenosine(37)-C2)-methylthiotransferase MiaB [Chitinophagales bacterium]